MHVDKRPLSIVVIGATGDLAQKKLFPALSGLFSKKCLPKDVEIIAFSRREWNDDDFRNFTQENNPRMPKHFLSEVRYHKGLLDSPEAFMSLAERIRSEKTIFFFSTAPEKYATSGEFLGKAVTKYRKQLGEIKVLIEKPFGNSEASAKSLAKHLETYFSESELWPVDHYLAKHALEQFLDLRITHKHINDFLSAKKVRKITVRMKETIDIGDRSEFYDVTGAVRDIGQNHVMEMLANVLMETPSSKKDVQTERLKAISALSIPQTSTSVTAFKKAQYEGYSAAETYFNIPLVSESEQWKGTEINLEGGKALDEAIADITVEGREGKLYIRIQPNPVIIFPDGKEHEVNETILGNYERIFHDAIKNDKTIFPSIHEIIASWNVIDSVLATWKDMPMISYKKGSHV